MYEKLYEHIMDGIRNALFEYADKTRNITPTVEMMKKWFDEFNDGFFNSELPPIKLIVGNCGNNTWGCFKFRRTYNTRTRSWSAPFDADKCSITLSNLYSGTEYNLKNTMIHEMVHYWIHYHYNYYPTRIHGAEFLHEARKINEKSEWNITPTNDYAENEITDTGLQKYKNRISGSYVICIFDSYDVYGKFHAIRTEDKYIEDVGKMLARWKCKSVKWYKFMIDDPKFGLQTRICRGGNSAAYILSGYTEDEVIGKLTETYNVSDYEEFEPDITNAKNMLYLCIMKRDRYICGLKLEDVKTYDKLVKKQGGKYKLELYEVPEYNDAFDIAYATKISPHPVFQTYDYDRFIGEMKQRYAIDIESLKKIKG